MFGLHVCEGHWYLKWLNKMNKLQVALERHKLRRLEEPLRETQKLKSKVRTEFKVFCIAFTCSLHWEVKWRCNNNIIIALKLEWAPLWAPHHTKLKSEVYSIFKHCFKWWVFEIHSLNTGWWKLRMSVSEACSKMCIEVLNEFEWAWVYLLCLL